MVLISFGRPLLREKL
jgi:acyl transferase domain-containing protein